MRTDPGRRGGHEQVSYRIVAHRPDETVASRRCRHCPSRHRWWRCKPLATIRSSVVLPDPFARRARPCALTRKETSRNRGRPSGRTTSSRCTSTWPMTAVRPRRDDIATRLQVTCRRRSPPPAPPARRRAGSTPPPRACSHHLHRRVADATLQHPGRPADAPAGRPHVEQRTDHAAHHRVAERVGGHVGDDHAVAVAGPKPLERTDRGAPRGLQKAAKSCSPSSRRPRRSRRPGRRGAARRERRGRAAARRRSGRSPPGSGTGGQRREPGVELRRDRDDGRTGRASQDRAAASDEPCRRAVRKRG